MIPRKNPKIFNLISSGEAQPSVALIIIQTTTTSENFTVDLRGTHAPTRPIHQLTSTAPTPTTPGFLCQDLAASTPLKTSAILDLAPLTQQQQ